MAPAPIDPCIVDVASPRKDTLGLPAPARERLEKSGIDLRTGYPYRPSPPLYLNDVYYVRNYYREHLDPGSRADPEKKALLSTAKELIPLTRHTATSASSPRVPCVSVMWPGLQATEIPANFGRPSGAFRWHSDLVHERQPVGVTHRYFPLHESFNRLRISHISASASSILFWKDVKISG
ncbi:Taurine catabolism dioxygenase TauD/TfdA [Penicillium sp. IBT 16267x]|nr:Taurine catabolism dioxygenase TauD/TfdA [Penicillium sp. IBT 16267x]